MGLSTKERSDHPQATTCSNRESLTVPKLEDTKSDRRNVQSLPTPKSPETAWSSRGEGDYSTSHNQVEVQVQELASQLSSNGFP